MTSVYHEDGIDEHGPVVKIGPEYGEYSKIASSDGTECGGSRCAGAPSSGR
ncbi:hypothetical protein MXD62_24250 [Frankia sp. Mgl5]|nr:hypothetical protein [Frankia sp. Mgl5]